MLIKIGYDIQLRPRNPTSIVFLLRVHPSRRADLVADEQFRVEPDVLVEEYIDTFIVVDLVKERFEVDIDYPPLEVRQSVLRTKP